LLSTNDITTNMLYVASTCNYIVRTYQRFCNFKCRADKYEHGRIIPAAVRAFVKGAFTPSVSLKTVTSVRFAIRNELAKQKKIFLKK